MALQVDVRVGEVIKLSGTGEVSIALKSKSGQLSRLAIDATDDINIDLPSRHKSTQEVVRDGLTPVKP